MNRKILKGIGLLLLGSMLIAGCSSIPSTSSSGKNDVIILHRAFNGELGEINPLSSSVIPTIDIDLHMHPDEKSKVIGKLLANTPGDIQAYELHTYPGKYSFEIDGKKGSILSYRGEGFFTVLVDNKIYTTRLRTEQKVESDVWLCIRNRDGFEGWTKIEPFNRWAKSLPGRGMFFPKAYVTGTDVNIRTQPEIYDNVIGQFKQFEDLVVIKMKDGWYYVEKRDGVKGWVSGKFIKFYR